MSVASWLSRGNRCAKLVRFYMAQRILSVYTSDTRLMPIRNVQEFRAGMDCIVTNTDQICLLSKDIG